MDMGWARVRVLQATVLVIFVRCNLQYALGETQVLPLEQVYLTPQSPVAYIESPNYPDAFYPANTQKQYHIEARMPDPVQQATARILLSFEIFLMEKSHFCYKDGLDIIDRFGQVVAFCGPQAGRTHLTDDAIVRMRMYTDGANQDRGFRIKARLYESKCSHTVRGRQSGLIKSPDYPYSYGAHRLCLWRIEAPRGKLVRLRFDGWFDVRSEDQETCLMDYIAVSRTGNFSTDIHRMCGQTRPTRITSKGNAIEIKFFSDCCEEGRGFQIRYDIVQPAPVTTPTPPYATPQTCSESKCGQPNIVAARIVGGGEYSEHKYPWLVAVMNEYDDFICTASLISARHVLTAAHCCHNQRRLYVRVGVHHLEEKPSLLVSRCTIHPGYKRMNYVNDIAVISLQRSVTLDDIVRPICLPITEDDDGIVGKKGVIAGWGRESEGGKDRVTPKEANVPFISNAECVRKYGPVILDSNICAGGNMEDACQGDSGGPLMSPWHVEGKYVQVGVVSTGIGCGRDGYPGIYSRVSKYRDFISNITREPWCSVDGDGTQVTALLERDAYLLDGAEVLPVVNSNNSTLASELNTEHAAHLLATPHAASAACTVKMLPFLLMSHHLLSIYKTLVPDTTY